MTDLDYITQPSQLWPEPSMPETTERPSVLDRLRKHDEAAAEWVTRCLRRNADWSSGEELWFMARERIQVWVRDVRDSHLDPGGHWAGAAYEASVIDACGDAIVEATPARDFAEAMHALFDAMEDAK